MWYAFGMCYEYFTVISSLYISKPGRCGRVVSVSACQASRGVAQEVNLRERISRMPLQSSNKAEPTLALKPRGDITRSPKQVYQWPQKWTCVQKKSLKKIIIHI